VFIYYITFILLVISVDPDVLWCNLYVVPSLKQRLHVDTMYGCKHRYTFLSWLHSVLSYCKVSGVVRPVARGRDRNGSLGHIL